jgi:hypothetical protein
LWSWSVVFNTACAFSDNQII